MTLERKPSNWEKPTEFGTGIILLLLVILLAVYFPKPTPSQALTFRVVLALAAGAFVQAALAGFVHLEANLPGIAIRSGGAIAVAIVVYLFNPPELVQKIAEKTESERDAFPSASGMSPLAEKPQIATPPTSPQAATPEASPSRQQSRFARDLTADQRKGLQAALSNVYVLTCTYHLDSETINSHDVAQKMYAQADAAFSQQLHSKAFEPLASDVDGLSKYKAMQGALAVYELQLSVVVQRSDYPGEWLNESISFAKDQRMKLKNALDAICDYSDIAKFDNP